MPKDIEDKVLLDIVANHKNLTLYNYALKMALVQCSAYKPGDPPRYRSTVFTSRSDDTSTHGLKVFELYVKNDNAYAYQYSQPQPEGQTLVKATWHSKEIQNPAENQRVLKVNDSVYLQPTTPSEYFIMFKSNNTLYATDEGWIYGIVSEDGKEVINKGLIKSCMSCHDASKHDRMLHAQ